MGESDPPVDDELSSCSSPPLGLSLPQNNTETKSKALAPIQPICPWCAPLGKKRGQQRQAPFGTGPRICAYSVRGHGSSVSGHASPIWGSFRPALVPFPAVRGLEDMLSSPLKVNKTWNDTRKTWNPPFEVGFTV